MNKLFARIVAGRGAVTLALGGVLGTVSAASASASSRPVMQAQDTGWSGMTVKPRRVYIGNGGSPYLTRLHWSHWSGSTAAATGRLHMQNPSCTPNYLCKYYSHWVAVYLHRVRTHNGIRYFSRMRWTRANGHRYYFRFGLEGGTVPAWH